MMVDTGAVTGACSGQVTSPAGTAVSSTMTCDMTKFFRRSSGRKLQVGPAPGQAGRLAEGPGGIVRF